MNRATRKLRSTAVASAVAGMFAFSATTWAQSPILQGQVPWAALTVQQQAALDPLKREWATIDPSRQRKWLDVAARYGSLTAPEQERIQLRMGEWARLTPEQRSRARLNYQELRQVTPDERQTRWEAYRSLPQERKSELAREAQEAGRVPLNRTRTDEAKSAVVKVPPNAPNLKPVNPTIVQARPGATTSLMSQPASPPVHQQAGMPKMTARPGFVDPQTLLPRRGVQGAAVASSLADKSEAPKR